MKAQKLYDFREKTAFTSGDELHKFFAAQTGDPSPSGYVFIDKAAANDFVAGESKVHYEAEQVDSVLAEWKEFSA